MRSSEFGVEKVEIYDLSGKKIFEQYFSEGEYNVEVDVSGLDAGMCVSRILLNGHQLTRKLLIQ